MWCCVAIEAIVSWQASWQQQQHGVTLRRKKTPYHLLILESMLSARVVAVGFTLLTAAKAMTSVAPNTSSESRGLRAAASRDAYSGSPLQRLQRLSAVPGCVPSRVNDLLLLRPDTDNQCTSEPKEKSNNKHVMFFHGDIQVSRMEGGSTTDLGGVSRYPGVSTERSRLA